MEHPGCIDAAASSGLAGGVDICAVFKGQAIDAEGAVDRRIQSKCYDQKTILRRIAMPRGADGRKDSEADQHGDAHADPFRRYMHVMSAHRQANYHDQESEYI